MKGDDLHRNARLAKNLSRVGLSTKPQVGATYDWHNNIVRPLDNSVSNANFMELFVITHHHERE